MRAVMIALLAAGSVLSLSCHVDQYCLNCDKDDGGVKDATGGGDAIDAAPDGGDAGSCVPSAEICDGKDNDCDGKIDEDPTDSDIGSACPNQKGDCSGGTFQCISGQVKCNKLGSAEICDGRDNDCDGVIDNGNPGDGVTQGGSKCGTDVGNCIAGTNTCVSGTVQCIGRVDGSAETCNAQDDDCDGRIDEGLTNLGSCGASNVGVCHFGTLVCENGGVVRCEGNVDPGFEICNGLDDDCDGKVDEGFDLDSDPQNCGVCGNVCVVPHAFAGCGGSPPACTVAACQSGFHDNNHDPSDGCEFGPCTITGNEVCDGVDNDCDGTVDDNLGPPPAICLTKGACAGAVASCEGSNGYVCDYGPGVSTDGSGNIVSETLCDGIDNDCDGKVDEGQPNLGQACNDGGIGACQGTGHFACDAANPNGPAICVIDKPGGTPSPEACDNIDNDCDGKIDEGANTGNLVGQSWINIGNNKQMMEFEATRSDATGSGAGAVNTTVCSKAGAQPWVDIDYPDAVTACASVGATLCSEQDWHRTCSVIAPSTYPIALAATGVVTQMVEAEDYSGIAIGSGDPLGTHSWVEDYLTDGTGRAWSGISDMQAIPDVGTSLNPNNTDVRGVAPRLDYQFNVQKASTYKVWVLLDAGNKNASRVIAAFDGTRPTGGTTGTSDLVGLADANTNAWTWVQVTQTFPLTVGVHTLNIYMARDGVRLDAIEITDGTTTPALPANPVGNTWSYATNPNVETTGVCNDHNFSAADDNAIATGTDTNCHTTTGVFDMSGNVKEWALAHQPKQNPIRGGASNNNDNGTTCALNFTLADDAFLFPNVGFRCCRPAQ